MSGYLTPISNVVQAWLPAIEIAGEGLSPSLSTAMKVAAYVGLGASGLGMLGMLPASGAFPLPNWVEPWMRDADDSRYFKVAGFSLVLHSISLGLLCVANSAVEPSQKQWPLCLAGLEMLSGLLFMKDGIEREKQRSKVTKLHLGRTTSEWIHPPDLKPFPSLETLWISGHRLASPPNLDHNPRLKNLSLSGHRNLQSLPSFLYNPELEEIEASACQIREVPDLSRLRKLRWLDLCINKIEMPPNTDENPQLELINLSHNPLQFVPRLNRNLELKTVRLNDARLFEAPDVTQNQKLETLSLSRNELRKFPDVSQNTQLISLNLSRNRLEELPDWVFSLSDRLTIYLEDNLFSDEYIHDFGQRRDLYKQEHPEKQGPKIVFKKELEAPHPIPTHYLDFHSPLPSDWSCSVCLENAPRSLVAHTEGGELHPNHKSCINRWLEFRPACPYCDCSVSLSHSQALRTLSWSEWIRQFFN